MSKVQLTAVSKIRLSVLHELAEKFGSMSALARHVGVAPGALGDAANLKEFPLWIFNDEHPRTMKLNELCLEHFGRAFRAMVPRELLSVKGLMPAKIERKREVDCERLVRLGAPEGRSLAYLPNLERPMELKDAVSKIINAEMYGKALLTNQEAKVLGMISEGMTLRVIAEHLGVCVPRVDQIRNCAIKKIQRNQNKFKVIKEVAEDLAL